MGGVMGYIYVIFAINFNWNIILEPANFEDRSIFDFSEYLSTLALLLVIYAISDFKYRYRFQLTRFNIKKIAFSLSFLIGFLILIVDLWFQNNFLIPTFLNNATNIKLSLGIIFLCIVGYMNYVAFLKPVEFKKLNAKEYFSTVHRSIGRGNENELKVVADELGYSAKSIIGFANKLDPKLGSDVRKVPAIAHNLLLLIANKKFCKILVEYSPWVIEEFFYFVSKEIKPLTVFGLFTKNIGMELITNKNSPLVYESAGYDDGYFGYTKPIGNSIFGNYDLVEFYARNHESPLNINFFHEKQLSYIYLEIYCNSALIFVESYLKSDRKYEHSVAFFQILGDVKFFSYDLYLANGDENNFYKSSPYKNTRSAVELVVAIVNLMDKYEIKPSQPIKRKERTSKCLFDGITDIIMHLLLSASKVTQPSSTAWEIQHNLVWSSLFDFTGESESWKIIKFKVRRALYDDISKTYDRSLFKGASYLGLCLNILGVNEFSLDRKNDFYPLHKLILKWVIKNYMKLREERPKVADACIQGSITFDAEKKTFIKTFSDNHRKEPSRQILQL